MTTNTKSDAMKITEGIVDQAIEAAESGRLNGLTYDQFNFCGTACCVAGFARHIAGLPERDKNLDDDEIEPTPRLLRLRRLMGCPTPDILRVMRAVDAEGIIQMTGAILRGADLTWAILTRATLRGADLTDADLTEADLRGADLRDANLTGANLDRAYLTGATMPDGAIHD